MGHIPGTFCTPPRHHGRRSARVTQHPDAVPQAHVASPATQVEESPPGSASAPGHAAPAVDGVVVTEARVRGWPESGQVAGVFRWATLPAVQCAQDTGRYTGSAFGATDVVLVRAGSCTHGSTVAKCPTCLAGLRALTAGAGAAVLCGVRDDSHIEGQGMPPTVLVDSGCLKRLQGLRGKGVTLTVVDGVLSAKQLSMDALVQLLQ